MKTKLERLERNEVSLEIEVDAERVEKALERAYRRVSAKVNVPGFRKGRVPRQVLEAYLGKEVLYEEALEEVVPQAYNDAVDEVDIEPVTQPNINVVQMEDGKPLIFKANVVVKPDVVLGELTGYEVEVEPAVVTDEEVAERLETMRNRYSKLVTLEDDAAAEMGDILTIDFTGYIDGEAFTGGAGEDYSLELGSNAFIPGFEEQLVGVRNGENREVNVVFPEDYHAQDLRGKEARFEVKVKEIKRRELAVLDDEFAKDVSEFETLEELKQDIRKTLEEMAEKRRQQSIRGQVVKKAVENAEFEIPKEMIDKQTDMIMSQFAERLSYQGLKLENYIEMSGMTVDMMRESFRPQAEQTLAENLVLEAIAKKFNISVTEEDYEKQLAQTAQEFGMSVDDIRVNLEGSRPRIEAGIKLDKAVDYLVNNAIIKEVEATAKEESEPTTEQTTE